MNPIERQRNALQEGLGGQFGEMRTMMRYLFQSFNARGKATPYKDLIQGIGIEEISHVELIATTINYLLDGSPRYRGTDPAEGGPVPGAGGSTLLDERCLDPMCITSSWRRSVPCRSTLPVIHGPSCTSIEALADHLLVALLEYVERDLLAREQHETEREQRKALDCLAH